MDRFNAMRVFTRIVELRGFAKAADSLQLPRASVTVLIKQLEAHLGVQLLQRTTRRLALTETGERYLERCRQILGQIDEADAEARGAHHTPSGRLRVHTMTGLGLQHLTPLIARYAERYPQVVVELTLAQRTPDLLEDGHDVTIAFARDLPDSQLVAQRLGPVYSVLCAAPSYLAEHGTPHDERDLQALGCVLYACADGSTPPLHFASGRQGATQLKSISGRLAIGDAEGQALAIMAGHGIAQLPTWLVQRPLDEGSLVEVLPEFASEGLPIHLAWLNSRQAQPKVSTLLTHLGQCLSGDGFDAG